MNEEIWRDIPNFEGMYQISNLGNVKNVSTGRILAKTYDGKGYRCSKLCKDGKRYYFLTHRLVAKCFLPNPYDYTLVNHKDGNTDNCCVDNLEWCNNSYNVRYRSVVKNNYYRVAKKNNNNAALSVCTLDSIGVPQVAFDSLADTGRNLPISQNTVRRSCRSGKPTTNGERFVFTKDLINMILSRQGYTIELYEK